MDHHSGCDRSRALLRGDDLNLNLLAAFVCWAAAYAYFGAGGIYLDFSKWLGLLVTESMFVFAGIRLASFAANAPVEKGSKKENALEAFVLSLGTLAPLAQKVAESFYSLDRGTLGFEKLPTVLSVALWMPNKALQWFEYFAWLLLILSLAVALALAAAARVRHTSAPLAHQSRHLQFIAFVLFVVNALLVQPWASLVAPRHPIPDPNWQLIVGVLLIIFAIISMWRFADAIRHAATTLLAISVLLVGLLVGAFAFLAVSKVASEAVELAGWSFQHRFSNRATALPPPPDWVQVIPFLLLLALALIANRRLLIEAARKLFRAIQKVSQGRYAIYLMISMLSVAWLAMAIMVSVRVKAPVTSSRIEFSFVSPLCSPSMWNVADDATTQSTLSECVVLGSGVKYIIAVGSASSDGEPAIEDARARRRSVSLARSFVPLSNKNTSVYALNIGQRRGGAEGDDDGRSVRAIVGRMTGPEPDAALDFQGQLAEYLRTWPEMRNYRRCNLSQTWPTQRSEDIALRCWPQ